MKPRSMTAAYLAAMLTVLALSAALAACGSKQEHRASPDPFADYDRHEAEYSHYGPEQLASYLRAVRPGIVEYNRALDKADSRAARVASKYESGVDFPYDVELRRASEIEFASWILRDALRGVAIRDVPTKFRAAHRLVLSAQRIKQRALSAYVAASPQHRTLGEIDRDPKLARTSERACRKLQRALRPAFDMEDAWCQLVIAEVRRLHVKMAENDLLSKGYVLSEDYLICKPNPPL